MPYKKSIRKPVCNNQSIQSAGGWVGDFFAGGYAIAADEETERASFGAIFSSVHLQNDSRICLNSLSLQHVINRDSAAQQIVICLTVI
jgi:hypothetical protein